MVHVSKAEYEEEFKIWIEFNDGVSGVVDLQDFLWGPVFEPLQDPANFKRFEVSEIFQTITWYNGADIAPEALYERLLRAKA